MKVNELIKDLSLKVYGKANNDKEISGGYASDLLSDVMGNAKEGNVWITMQTHKNIVAVASLKDISALIISSGNVPSQETIEAADEEDVTLLGTDESSFNIIGKIYGHIYK